MLLNKPSNNESIAIFWCTKDKMYRAAFTKVLKNSDRETCNSHISHICNPAYISLMMHTWTEKKNNPSFRLL